MVVLICLRLKWSLAVEKKEKQYQQANISTLRFELIGRTIPPKDAEVLFPGTCEYAPYVASGKGELRLLTS